MPDLFSPIKIGSIEAKNRVFMAPLTRLRATENSVPTKLMAQYYAQRASAGLIISEATGISRVGLGLPTAPGIYTEEQVEHWKPVVQAVHDKGGKIICQLWHMGRATHSKVIGRTPVSCSATKYPTQVHTGIGKEDPEEAHPLTVDEIKSTIEDYRQAAINAMRAGFDGVQIHAANGYLIDQFLRDSTNFRTDEYGGSIANRVRFLDEVVSAVVSAVGSEQTSIRYSPNGDAQGAIDSNHRELFTEAAKIAQKYQLAMVELRENSPQGTFLGTTNQPKVHDSVREVYKGVLVLNQDYTKDQATAELEQGVADAISFGRKYIANPDLVSKLQNNEPIDERNTMPWWYSRGAEGYTEWS